MKQFFKILFFFLIISICIGQRPYYKGEWKKNRYHGNGELLDKFGNKYVGEFFEGIKHGRGVLKYSNGARFEGQFIDGKKTEGTYYYSNGTKYIGKWKRGKKHGNGIFVNRDGVKENQTWANGKIQIDNEKETNRDNLFTSKRESSKLNSEIDKKEISQKSKDDPIRSKFASADKLFLSKKYDDAKTIYQEIIKLDPLNAESYARLGNLFYDIDKYDLAEEKYRQALEIDSKSPSALNGLGNISYRVSNYDESIKLYLEAYKNANALEVSTSIIVDNLANTYDLIGQKDEAIQYYEQLSALNYANPNLLVQLRLADAYKDNYLIDKADEILIQLLEKAKMGHNISAYMGDDISILSFEGSDKNKIKYRYDEEQIRWRLSNKHASLKNNEGLSKGSKIDESELEGTPSLSLSVFYKSLDCIDHTLIDTTISLFMDSLKNDSSNARAYYGLSKLFFRTGDLKKANEYAVEAVQLQQEFKSWWNQLDAVREYINEGNKNFQQDLFDEAIRTYNKITTIDSCFPGSEFFKGMVRFRQKNIEGAATYFSNALKIYPNHEKAKKGLDNIVKQLFNEGNKSYKSGDISRSISNYQKAIMYDPQFHIAHHQLGVIQKKQGQIQLAIESFQKVLDIKPEHDKTWFALGSLYDSEGTTEKAVEHYKKALEINSSYSKASGNLAKIFTDEENYKEAENVLITALELDTEYADGYMRLGIVYIEQEQYTDAISSLEKSVDLDKDDFNKFYLLSRSYNNVQKWDEALNAANSCTNLNEKFGGGWAELGIAEFGKGNNDLALEYFEKAKQDPDWEKFVERKIDEILNPQKYQNS